MSTGEGVENRFGAMWRAVTPLGRSVAGAGVLLWAVAGVTGWREAAVAGAASLLALCVGLAFLLLSTSKLVVLLELATPRVVVGDAASTVVEASNPTGRPTLPTRLETRVGRGIARMNVPTLGVGASHDELFVIPTKRRSIVPVGPVRSVQGDPLGLVRREIEWTGTEHLYVHPRTTVIGPLTTGWMRDLEGETTNDRSPSDVAFHTLREYVVGDDRRHIHWRTTARQVDGKLMVREFVDTRRAHVGLLLSLDRSAYASDDELELAVSVLGSLGLRALADEQEVTCVAGEHPIPAFQGPVFLDRLAGLDASDAGPSLADVAGRARDRFAAASVAFVITGSAAEMATWRAAVDHLGRSVRTVVVIASDGRESRLRAVAGATVVEIGDLGDLNRLVHSAVVA